MPKCHSINDEVKYTQKSRAMQMNLFTCNGMCCENRVWSRRNNVSVDSL